jgi:hypothetical protein
MLKKMSIAKDNMSWGPSSIHSSAPIVGADVAARRLVARGWELVVPRSIFQQVLHKKAMSPICSSNYWR